MQGTHLVLAKEGMPMASPVHVLIPVQDESDRPPQQPGWHCSCSIAEDAAGLLATEPASDALHMAHHLVLRDAQHMCNCGLVLGGCLQQHRMS